MSSDSLPISEKRLLKKYTIKGVIIIFFFLGVTFLYEILSINYIEDNWERISTNEKQYLIHDIQSRFKDYQNETLNILERIADSPELKSILLKNPDSSFVEIFELLLKRKHNDVSVELFDRHKSLLGWAGNRGKIIDTSEIKSWESSFLLKGQIYSYLIVSIPIFNNQNIIGFLIGKRLFEVNYPISNRFIDNEAFASTFKASSDGLNLFKFFVNDTPRLNMDELAIPLMSIDNQEIGTGYIPLVTSVSYSSKLLENINKYKVILVLLIYLFFVWQVIASVKVLKSPFIKLFSWTILIWFFRYLLIWLNVPSIFLQIEIYEPKYFASPFGFGIVKSLGDLFLSSLFLIANIAVIVNILIQNIDTLPKLFDTRLLRNKIVSVVLVAILVLLIFLFIRGLAATIRSAVFDSTLIYSEAISIIPSVEVSIMLLSLLMIAIAIIATIIGLIFTIHHIIQSASGIVLNEYFAWWVGAVIIIVGGIFFGILQQNPLITQINRTLYLIVLLTVTFWIAGRYKNNLTIFDHKFIIAIIIVAIIFVVPLLQSYIQEKNKVNIELLAEEIIRPEDSWLSFLLNKSLDELTSDEVVLILQANEGRDYSTLAFTQWAKSVLSKEGNNCAITYLDNSGSVLSDFRIGLPKKRIENINDQQVPRERFIHQDEINQNAMSVKWYTGYAPIITSSENVIGGVYIELTGGKQSIFRAETPTLLRNYTDDESLQEINSIIYSEYVQGKLMSTTSDAIPLNITIPDPMLNLLAKKKGYWVDEVIENKNYSSYYFRDPKYDDANICYALRLEGVDLKWQLFYSLRFILLYATLFLILFATIILYKSIRKKTTYISFRTRLLFAFVILSFVPIILLGYYNRQYAEARIRDNIAKTLSDKTSVVLAEMQHRFNVNTPVVLSNLSDEQCIEMAGDLNTDFHIYSDSYLQATSNPEMFTAELLNPWLDAEAVLNIFLKQKGYYTEKQSIGHFAYIVGYRPIRAENNSIIGVVAVPSLFQESEIITELTNRNIFLFGAYSFVLIFSFILAVILANQISAPIKRLKKATQLIAAGKLDINDQSDRHDELGDLEKAFYKMTTELKAVQDQIIKAQREAAWKEMAKQVAHEIKNPLTPIKLSIQHLRQAYEDGIEDFRAVLHRVSSAVLEQIDTLSRIASEFSNFARMPDRKLELLDIHTNIQDTISLFSQHKNISFETALNSSAALLIADKEELQRAFINIIRNAIQAMNESGTIGISTILDGRFIKITITDTGSGISEEIKSRIFEPNFSTKTDGMGLGLSIVKKTIDDISGTISIESTAGKGTSVIIRLQLSDIQTSLKS
ncbi:MAG: ATP-binding protein [Bacteroidota bacterium]|nr:ATP-binding protein [Bacteroidota bacterium]